MLLSSAQVFLSGAQKIAILFRFFTEKYFHQISNCYIYNKLATLSDLLFFCNESLTVR